MNNLRSAFQGQLQTPPPVFSNEAFTKMLQQLAAAKYDSENILDNINRFFNHHQLLREDFPVMKNYYTRTVLLKEQSGFEIMMARWDKGAVTPIHGHPEYALMYVIEGQLSEQLFLPEEDRLMKVSTLNYYPGDYSYHKGDSEQFDNSIHRLTAVTNSLSLHVYSDDGLKGKVYRVSK
jgi:predicted metal-dependent enzyme (double-stranded beta helix superfamily)